MTPEDFLITQITEGLPEWAEQQIISKYKDRIITDYRRGVYKDIPEMVKRVRKNLKLETYLTKGTTAQEYSRGAKVSETTGRKRLEQTAEKVVKEKRPYIYQGWGNK